jgi:hypothetical protein
MSDARGSTARRHSQGSFSTRTQGRLDLEIVRAAAAAHAPSSSSTPVVRQKARRSAAMPRVRRTTRSRRIRIGA